MIPGTVILVRHGETAWNKESRFLGQSNPGLNEKGEIQAQAAADVLMNEDIDLIFSSDLRRALQTAEAIAGTHQMPVRVITSLREINFGDWEGLTFDILQSRYPALCSEWIKNPWAVRIPGGETAEEVRCRVAEAWNAIVLIAAGRKTVVIVAHGGPLRILMCQLTGVDPSRQWEFNLGHGEVKVLKKNGDLYMQSGNRDRKDATPKDN